MSIIIEKFTSLLVRFSSHFLRHQKRQVSYLSFLLANNHRSNFCFVAMPRIECVSATKGVVSLLAKASSQLISKGNVSMILLLLFFDRSCTCLFCLSMKPSHLYIYKHTPQCHFKKVSFLALQIILYH